MKYLAILKDSVREALDSTVLYVMIGLSTLVILFVATLSFRPLAAEKTLEKLVDGTFSFLGELQKSAKLEHVKRLPARLGVYQLDKVELVSGEPDSPDSEYRLTISQQFVGRQQAAEVRKDPKEAVVQIQDHFASVAEARLMRIRDIRLSPAQPEDQATNRVRFLVTTAPDAGTRRIWFTEPSFFFGAVPLSDVEAPLGLQLYLVTSIVISIGSWVAILAGVIISSFFIPNMLRKGTIDLLLVKPIRRPVLLLYKYVGGLTFIFINNAYAILGIWLVLGLRSGIWANWFLLLIFILTFFFAILYSVSTLMAVLTRNSVTAILVTVGVWFICFVVGFVHHGVFEQNKRLEEIKNVPVEKRRWTNNVFGKVVGVVHFVLPRTSDLGQLSSLIIVSDFLTGSWSEASKFTLTSVAWGESLLVSAVFIALMLGLSCWRFAKKDY
jgi:ABC-type transport system involved in multi-copper enzyme maturation permease subunit